MSKPLPMKSAIESLCDAILDLPASNNTNHSSSKSHHVASTLLDKILLLGRELRELLAKHDIPPSPPPILSPELLYIKSQPKGLATTVLL